MMNKPDGHSPKPVTLYDAGGWFLMGIFFGVAFVGVVIDYFWNFLVFHFSLRRLHFDVGTGKKFVYCLIITALGFLIDWLYYEFTWGTLVIGDLRVPAFFWRPGIQPVLEWATILIPMVILAAVNFLVSFFFLRMRIKQAAVMGAVMGVFTAPWLIVVYVLSGA